MKLTVTDRKRLQKIRDLVETTHWTKRAYRRITIAKDMYCLTGLVNVTTGAEYDMHSSVEAEAGLVKPNRSRRRILDALHMSIKTLHPTTRADVIEHWNDLTKTKREDVLAVIDKALEEAK